MYLVIIDFLYHSLTFTKIVCHWNKLSFFFVYVSFSLSVFIQVTEFIHSALQQTGVSHWHSFFVFRRLRSCSLCNSDFTGYCSIDKRAHLGKIYWNMVMRYVRPVALRSFKIWVILKSKLQRETIYYGEISKCCALQSTARRKGNWAEVHYKDIVQLILCKDYLWA